MNDLLWPTRGFAAKFDTLIIKYLEDTIFEVSTFSLELSSDIKQVLSYFLIFWSGSCPQYLETRDESRNFTSIDHRSTLADVDKLVPNLGIRAFAEAVFERFVIASELIT